MHNSAQLSFLFLCKIGAYRLAVYLSMKLRIRPIDERPEYNKSVFQVPDEDSCRLNFCIQRCWRSRIFWASFIFSTYRSHAACNC